MPRVPRRDVSRKDRGVQPEMSSVLYARSDPNGPPALEAIGRLGPSLGLQVLPAAIDSPQGIESILRRLKQQAQGLRVISGGLTWTNRAAIATGALANRLPSAYGHPDTVAVGELMSLGTDLRETARQGAASLDQLLRGTKPAELPVQLPRKYELHINAGTANALGLTIPPSPLQQADQVIE